LLVVVGFDGSEAAYRALNAARRLISGRIGIIEIVYVAHVPVGVEMFPYADVDTRSGFDVAEREFPEAIRARLAGLEQRWHFQRRDGLVVHEIMAAAEELSCSYGEHASVVIVIGSAMHAFHHVVGSVPVALVRHAKYPVVVVP
jgi:nucleotide-binding universal stress UspA family protein